MPNLEDINLPLVIWTWRKELVRSARTDINELINGVESGAWNDATVSLILGERKGDRWHGLTGLEALCCHARKGRCSEAHTQDG